MEYLKYSTKNNYNFTTSIKIFISLNIAPLHGKIITWYSFYRIKFLRNATLCILYKNVKIIKKAHLKINALYFYKNRFLNFHTN